MTFGAAVTAMAIVRRGNYGLLAEFTSRRNSQRSACLSYPPVLSYLAVADCSRVATIADS